MDKYLDYKDVKGFYSDEGNGEAILFVHGFGEDGSVWDEFRKVFTGYRTIAVDLPGYGNTGLPEGKTSVESMAEFVKAILDKEGIEKVHFVGHSMGGYIAMAFAEKYPQMMDRLVMFHTHPYADNEEKKDNRRKSAELVRKNGTKLFISELYNNLFADKFKSTRQSFIKEKVEKAQQYSSDAVMASLLAMAERPDRSEVMKNISSPVLFIIGKEDKAVPYDKMLEQTHLPAVSEVHIIEGIGHMGMYEATKETQEMILTFLKRDLK